MAAEICLLDSFRGCNNVKCWLAVKVLLVGELLSTSVYGDVAADEFNQCPASTKSQRYLDSLYRCHPGEMDVSK